jgi:hypothetical protein
MSNDTDPSPEVTTDAPAKSVPRARRVAVPKAKKVAKTAASAATDTTEGRPSNQPMTAVPEPSHTTGTEEWPEPESASNGGTAGPSETNKRKRRRRKGKGQSNGPANAEQPAQEQPNHADTELLEPTDEPAASPPPRPIVVSQPFPKPPQNQPQRLKIDPELLTKMAWKIYLAEISEEGVALIGDNDAKELSRRCFRLAEIFIEEQSRRR